MQTRACLGVVVVLAAITWGCGERGGDATGTTDVVETLRIGKDDGSDEYLIGRINDIALGPNGDIYILDGQRVLVRQYDRDGRYIRDIGHEGEGPGEYPQPLGVEVAADGTVAVLTARPHRIILYDDTGTYLRDIRIPSFYQGPGMFYSDRDGHLYVRAVAVQPPPMNAEWPCELIVATQEGDIIARVPVPMEDVDGTGGVLYTGEGPEYFFQTSTRSAWSPLGYFVTGRNDAYAIQLRDTTGVIGRFEHDYTPVELSGAERDQWQAWADYMWKNNPAEKPSLADVKPVFRDIMVGDDGRIWVNRHVPALDRHYPPRPEGDDRPSLSWREPRTWDVFEPEGRFLATVVMPEEMWPVVMRGHEVYALQDTDQGQQVVRLETPSLASN